MGVQQSYREIPPLVAGADFFFWVLAKKSRSVLTRYSEQRKESTSNYSSDPHYFTQLLSNRDNPQPGFLLNNL
jgi:hypothetical protein